MARDNAESFVCRCHNLCHVPHSRLVHDRDSIVSLHTAKGHLLRMSETKGATDRLLVLSKTRHCVVKRWCVAEGEKVRRGTVLCTFLANGETKEEDLRSPCVGVLTHIAAQVGKQVEKK